MTTLGHYKLPLPPFRITLEMQSSTLELAIALEGARTLCNGKVVTRVCGRVLDKCLTNMSTRGTQRHRGQCRNED